jgi:hypothetical protein
MIQVIADATLLHYLIEIQAIEVLPGLFGRIITPPVVIQDLQHASTPVLVRNWIVSPPPWVVVQAPYSASDPAVSRLGAGEREAILLAHEPQPALLVTNDRRARRVAEARDQYSPPSRCHPECACARRCSQRSSARKVCRPPGNVATPMPLLPVATSHVPKACPIG